MVLTTIIVVVLSVFEVSNGYSAQYDIILKGGHVIDPANDRNSIMDVAIADGKIAKVEKNIPATDAKITYDVSGYYVSPGFIDIHVHAFYTFTKNSLSVNTDYTCDFGTTTVVDAGTSGADDFEDFKKVIDASKTRILAFLNIAASGMYVGEQDPLQFKVQKAVAMAKKYPELIVGFKSAHYGPDQPYDFLHTPWASVDSTLAAGREAGLPVMFDVHPREAPGDSSRLDRELLLEKMRSGDIRTHCYGGSSPVLDQNSKVNQYILEAQKKGRIFDLGHGAGSFYFEKAIPSFEQGYFPNSISTDLHSGNIDGPVYNMLHVMSKLLCMGIPLEEIIRLSTINPALFINRPELGSLTEGYHAEIAVFEELKGVFDYFDVKGNKLVGDKKLQNVMTIYGGEILYKRFDIPTFVETENIPEKLNLKIPYPNPFNIETSIEYYLPEDSHVTLTIYNVTGQPVSVLKDEYQQTGNQSVIWKAEGLSSGLYFCTLKARGLTETEKMLLLK